MLIGSHYGRVEGSIEFQKAKDSDYFDYFLNKIEITERKENLNIIRPSTSVLVLLIVALKNKRDSFPSHIKGHLLFDSTRLVIDNQTAKGNAA